MVCSRLRKCLLTTHPRLLLAQRRSSGRRLRRDFCYISLIVAGLFCAPACLRRKVVETHLQSEMETAVLGGGCFWCLEAVFERLRGVAEVESGYTCGPQPNPSYEQVCTGETGHAEVVKVRFDPAVISYRDLLEIFFTLHDPTTLNRQGNDVGTQYRSVIYYQSPEQEATARAVIAQMAGVWDAPIATELSAPQPHF